MVNQDIKCEICGRHRHWKDTGVESAKGEIHGVPVSRHVTHCGDTGCKEKARIEADQFAARWPVVGAAPLQLPGPR